MALDNGKLWRINKDRVAVLKMLQACTCTTRCGWLACTACQRVPSKYKSAKGSDDVKNYMRPAIMTQK